MSTLQERIEAAFKDEIEAIRGYTLPFGKSGGDMFDHILRLLERDAPFMAEKHGKKGKEEEITDEQRTRYAYGDPDCPRCGLPKKSVNQSELDAELWNLADVLQTESEDDRRSISSLSTTMWIVAKRLKNLSLEEKPDPLDIVDAFSDHLDELYDSFDESLSDDFFSGFLRAQDEVRVNLKYYVDGTLPKPEPQIADDDPLMLRIAEALWTSDGYDLNGDPDSSTARDLRPEYIRRAKAVMNVRDDV